MSLMCPPFLPDSVPIIFLLRRSSVESLDYVISSEGLKMDQEDVRKFLIDLLEENSRLFNHSLVLQTFTTVSSRIILRQSVHSPSSSRNIQFPPSMGKLLVSFTNSKTAFTTSPILLYPPL
ncbi:hypothetical protein O181_016085 [Austropuccinia psidii MF-1]|uniref:Uncharacterized protein n=1 Tax=Austropuccinia psidii MF-1 TaxID=1389203 RepID=A0A9Q3C537_9BASI|nr:hypothetical protein [Austropuccinia psidii MF-1]